MIYHKEYVVYLLSRSDMNTMTAGKELAHAQHAGVQMIAKYFKHKDVQEYIKQGLDQGADHFNTTITLEASLKQIKNIVAKAKKSGYVADLVIDPTYPYFAQNGVVCLGKETTMGWLLGDKNDKKFRKLTTGLKLKEHNKNIYKEIGDKKSNRLNTVLGLIP